MRTFSFENEHRYDGNKALVLVRLPRARLHTRGKGSWIAVRRSLSDRIGSVEEGKDADLILVAGNPLEDVGVLVDARNIPLVLKSGEIVKDEL